jgi:SAM-dependent methyltransferase
VDKYLENNLELWDAMVPHHVASAFYDVDGFRAGRDTLRSIEIEQVGDVAGKSLLHLQCHFGLDTLSWARRGAQVVGMDFSGRAVEAARSLAGELGIEARFVCCNLYDLPEHLDGEFDIVFTSYGVLCWLPDITRWGTLVARYLKPGGFFHIVEGHPLENVFYNERDARSLDVRYSYFHREQPDRWEAEGTYADRNAAIANPSYEWQHSLSDIINALIGAGLQLNSLHEFPFGGYDHFPFSHKRGDGFWDLNEPLTDTVPQLFSLKAHKPNG